MMKQKANREVTYLSVERAQWGPNLRIYTNCI